LPNFFVADFFGRRLCLDYPSPRFIHDENVVWKTLQRPIRFLGSSENLFVILELSCSPRRTSFLEPFSYPSRSSSFAMMPSRTSCSHQPEKSVGLKVTA
jgi:hypothetical protein